jgi:hypothetical protein
MFICLNVLLFPEFYDIRANEWTKINLQDPLGERCYVGTAVVGHKIFMAGGSNGTNHLQQVSCLDVSTGEFEVVSSMNHKRCFLTMSPIDDNHLLAMGKNLFHTSSIYEVIFYCTTELRCLFGAVITSKYYFSYFC